MGFPHYNTVMKRRTTACLEEFFSSAFGHVLVILQTSASGERKKKRHLEDFGFSCCYPNMWSFWCSTTNHCQISEELHCACFLKIKKKKKMFFHFISMSVSSDSSGLQFISYLISPVIWNLTGASYFKKDSVSLWFTRMVILDTKINYTEVCLPGVVTCVCNSNTCETGTLPRPLLAT